MKVVLMKGAVLILRLVYLAFRPLKMKNKITILSRQSNRMTTDIRLLYEELKRRNAEVAVLTRRLTKSVPGGIRYGFHMLRQMYHISTSRVIVIDGYCILASVLKKKEGQRIVQIWHSLGAIKKFGYQSVGKPGGNREDVAKVMKLHKNYDYAIAPSRVTAEIYSRAFKLSIDRIKIYGLPRIDYLMEYDPEKVEKIKADYPQTREKPNVLYAPTFRKNRKIDITEFIRNARLDKYNLVIRKHWLDKTDYSWARDMGVIVDKQYSFFDWLRVCDKVITDYSAAAFEAAILDKELYFYIDDTEEYEKNIGLNIDFTKEAISEFVYNDAGMLWDFMDKPYDKKKVREFREKYIEVELSDCTKRLADFFEEMVEAREILR